MGDRGTAGGWIGASLGCTCWLMVLAGLLLARGQIVQGLVGLLLFGIAATVCCLAAPWKHPDTPYWKLMLAMFGTPVIGIAWAVWAFGAKELGFTPWVFLMLAYAVLFPLWTAGRRRYRTRCE